MSGFLLDTNVPSELLRPRPDVTVTVGLQRQAKETMFLSVGQDDAGGVSTDAAILTVSVPRCAGRVSKVPPTSANLTYNSCFVR